MHVCMSLFAYSPPSPSSRFSSVHTPVLSVCVSTSALQACHCSGATSWPTLYNPMECSPPGLSVHGFSRQEYWSGLPCLPPGNLPHPGIEPRSPSLQANSLLSEPPRKLRRILEWVAYPFSRGSSVPKNWIRVFCIAGRFFTRWATREASVKVRDLLHQSCESLIWVTAELWAFKSQCFLGFVSSLIMIFFRLLLRAGYKM